MKIDGQELRLQIWDTAGQGATLCTLVVVDLDLVLSDVHILFLPGL